MANLYLTAQQSRKLRETLEALAILLDSAAFSPEAYIALSSQLAGLTDSLSPASRVRHLIRTLLLVPAESLSERRKNARIWDVICELWERCHFEEPLPGLRPEFLSGPREIPENPVKKIFVFAMLGIFYSIRIASGQEYPVIPPMTQTPEQQSITQNQTMPAAALPMPLPAAHPLFPVMHRAVQERETHAPPVMIPKQKLAGKSLPALQAKEMPAPLVTNQDLQGQIGFFPYEPVGKTGIRFRYSRLEGEESGHRWFFSPRDLRGKTIQISYSGIVPNEIFFTLSRSSASAELKRLVRLRNTSEPRTFLLWVPWALPFKDVSLLKLEIETTRAGKQYGDFLIEKVEVLPGFGGAA